MNNTRFISTLILMAFFIISGCAPAEQSVPTISPEQPVAATAVSQEAAAELKQEGPISNEKIELVISTWGAVYIDLMNQKILPELQKLYPNVSFVFEEGSGAERYNKLLANKDNPVVDIFIISPDINLTGFKEGVIQPFNPDNVPNAKEGVFDWGKPDSSNMGVAFGGYVYGIGYNPDFFGDNPPTSWKDFWRPEVQGKQVLPPIGHSYMVPFLEKISEVYGGTASDITPALDQLALLKPAAQTTSYVQYSSLYEAGDVVIITDWDYSFLSLRRQGKNVLWVNPKEGGLAAATNAAIVKGTKHPEVAEAFLNIFLSKEVQEAVGPIMGQTPVRMDVTLPDDMASNGLVCCQDNVKWPNFQHMIDKRSEYAELMTAKVAPAWGAP